MQCSHLKCLVENMTQLHFSLDNLLFHCNLYNLPDPGLEGFSVRHKDLSISIHVGHQLNLSLVFTWDTKYSHFSFTTETCCAEKKDQSLESISSF